MHAMFSVEPRKLQSAKSELGTMNLMFSWVMTAKNQLGIERSCPIPDADDSVRGIHGYPHPLLSSWLLPLFHSDLRGSDSVNNIHHSPLACTCLGNVSIHTTLIRHLYLPTHVMISPNNIYKLFCSYDKTVVNVRILHDKLYIGDCWIEEVNEGVLHGQTHALWLFGWMFD
jgi:hypothetical protein